MTTFSSELSGSLIFASGSEVQARIVPGSSSLAITGALHVSGADITFDGVSVLDRLSNLESGGVSDSASLGPLNRTTGSLNIFTASIQSEVAAIKITTGSLTSSVETLTSQVSSLITVTGSYLLTSSTYYSESAQISSSLLNICISCSSRLWKWYSSSRNSVWIHSNRRVRIHYSISNSIIR